MKSVRLWACAFVLMAGAAHAQAVLYDCDITKKDARVGWLSPKVALVVDAKGNATAIDAVILHFLNEPIPARLRKSGGKLRFSWKISGARDSRNQRVPTFRYSAVIDEKTNAVQLVANPTDSPQQWSGRGSCVVRKDAKLPKALR